VNSGRSGELDHIPTSSDWRRPSAQSDVNWLFQNVLENPERQAR